MSLKKPPLMRVKEQFGSKEKLVDALVAMPAKVLPRRDGEDKDAFRARLLTAANSKLLRLYERAKIIQSRWGSKEQLVEAVLGLQNRIKDQGYRSKLSAWSLGRLHDRVTALERAQRRRQRGQVL
ncbi:MAG: hypothetical protein RMK29_04850 [Myxococcales bacterium]|nr:hypothetical protein [Myxococcota bacterium]MDW8281018.1 hypothetical protein [Myxococcales bacterium]